MAELGHLGIGDGPEVHVRPPARLPVDTDILAPIDLSSIRDGAFPDESEGGESLVINTPVNPDKPVFNLAFVSAVGNNEAEVTVRNVFGKEQVKTMKSQELFMLERQKYSGMKMTEVASKREGTFGNKALTFIERTWKTTIGRKMHEVKEARVGGKLMIASGVDTAITAEFDAVIDQKARENIKEQRNNWFKQLTGNIRDVGNEIIGREKDLHREKIKIAGDLRNEYLQDPSNSKHPYAELLNRDMVAREAVAEKFATTPVDFLSEHGDKAREVALAPDSKVAKFLQEQIFKKVIADAIAQSDAGTYDGKNGGISAKLRPELDKTLKDYFFGDEFTTWRNGLSPEEQKVFENSLTYTNNVLSQAETVLMPMVHDHLTYFKTNQDIDFDIKLKLGTGQFGPNNEVVGTSIFSKDRISKNASVYEKLRKSISGDQSKLYTQGDVSKGLKQEMMMAALNAVVSNEVAAAAAGALLGGTAKTLLRSSVAWLPILGSGLVAGGVSGAKEYANLGKMRERFGEQVAEGYTHPVGVNAVRAEALRKVDYHRIDLGLRSEQLLHVATQIKEGDKSPETILQTLGYLADSKARVALSDKRHINLFHASTDTPTGRGVYQKQEALHTQARVLATTKLHELLNGDVALRTEIANKIGFATTLTSEQILDGLSAFQGEFLENGITLNVNIKEALKAVTSAEVKSIVGQDKAFQKWRWKEVSKRAATTAVIAGSATGLMHLGMEEYSSLHQEAITTVEHKVHTIIDQSVTSHASPLSIAEVQDPSTNEIIASMTAHIPKGTTLMSDMSTPGAYDLVLTNEPHRVLVDNMTFTDEGFLNMTTEVRESLAHAHIDYHAVSTGEIEIGAPDSSFVGTETLRFGDLPGAHEGGFDQWFANTLNHSYRVNPEPEVAGQMMVERTTQINGLREMLYAWEDHEKFLGHTDNFRLIEEPGYHQVMHIDDATGRYLSEPQANGFFMDNVPKIFTSEEGHRKIADFINESVRLKLSGGEMTPAQEIAYTMSYDGTPGSVPTPEEFEILMTALGENSTETVAKTVSMHDAWFTMSDDLVDIQTVTTTEVVNHTIPNWANAASFAVSTSVPLEAPIGESRQIDIRPLPVPPPERGTRPAGGGYGSEIDIQDFTVQGYDETISNLPSGEKQPSIEDYYKSRMLPQLAADRKYDLKFAESVDWYLSKQDPEYIAALEKLNENQKPMGENTKFVVGIPVAAGQEGKNIYGTLQKYAAQVGRDGKKINSQWEVVLFLNRPENVPEDNTAKEIERFVRDNPGVNIVPVYGVFEPGKVKYGAFIKYAYDLGMLRARRRTVNGDKDIIIATGDADLADMSPTYIADSIDHFERHQEKDAGLAKQDMDSRILAEFPTFYATVRFQQMVEAQARGSSYTEGRRHIQTQGRTTLMRGSMLAALGGPNSLTGAGADTELGKMLLLARTGSTASVNGPDTPLDYLNSPEIKTNPRRELNTILSGRTYVQTWDTFDDAINDDDVRKKDMTELIREYGSDKIDMKEFERQVNSFKKWNVWLGGKHVQRALNFLGLNRGVDYIIEGSGKDAQIKFISNGDGLQDNFKKFKARVSERSRPN